MENLYPKYGLVSRTYSKKSLIMESIFGFKSKSFMTMSIPSQDEPLTNRPKLRDLNPKESWSILKDLALYENKSWNDPRDFAKPVKAIALPQDVPKDDEEVMFIEIIRDDDEPQNEDPNEERGADEVAYKMPHKIEQYDSLLDLEKEHTKSVYLRNEEDKRRRVEYVMSKILGFYKECLELGPEYLTGVDEEGEVT
ncbi:hypothetical protein Tco_0221698 [Tanacetum coccineum]